MSYKGSVAVDDGDYATIPDGYRYSDYLVDAALAVPFVKALDMGEDYAIGWTMRPENGVSVEAFGRATAYLERAGIAKRIDGREP